MNAPRRAEVEAMLATVSAVTRSEQKTRVLEAIAWPQEVETRFFADGAQRDPEVTYTVDRDALDARVASLDAAIGALPEDDVVGRWLRSVLASMRDANRLLLALGTRTFYRISQELYGSAKTRFHGGLRNVDLATHLFDRLRVHGWDEADDPPEAPLTAQDLATSLRARAEREQPGLALEVRIDPSLTAKVVAGSTRVRIRADATFTPWEAEGLWHHEVETHCLSAQNGAAQSAARFLRAGGPRSTSAQEGLAVFAEMYHHCLSVERMQRLARRVILVGMAEDGASFVELYRHLVTEGSTPREAFLDAQRVCRGGRVAGGAPFTKDACYLAGLLDVQAFLTAVVRGGLRDELELLVCGRIDLDDLHALIELRQLGILGRPRFLPAWLRRWRALLPEFAFASFLDGVSLAPVAAHFADLIATATTAARP